MATGGSDDGAPPPTPPRPKSVRRKSELQHLPYYHMDLQSMEDVKHLLFPYIQVPGHFIVRNSFRNKGSLTVSVVHEGCKIKHFSINEDNNFYFLQEKYFSTVSDLIRNYAHEDVPNLENVSHVRLLYPVVAGAPDPRSGQKSPVRYATSPKKANILKRAVSERVRTITEPPETTGTGRRYIPSRKLSEGNLNPVVSPVLNRVGIAEDVRQSAMQNFGQGFESQAPYNLGTIVTPQAASPLTSALKQTVPSPSYETRSITFENDLESEIYTSEGLNYSRVKSEVDKFPKLLQSLRVAEAHEKCECGIYIRDSDFPEGWTIHRSKEPETMGKLFFMNEELNITSWFLPESAARKLERRHEIVLKNLGHHGPLVLPVHLRKSHPTGNGQVTLSEANRAALIPRSPTESDENQN